MEERINAGEMMPDEPGEAGRETPGPGPRRPARAKKPPRRVTVKACAIITVTLLAVVIIVMLVTLLPGYERYNAIKKVAKGANVVTLDINSDIGVLEAGKINPVGDRLELLDIFSGMGAERADVRITINYPQDQEQGQEEEQPDETE
ncbi:MAG: hypothetical protein ACYC55_01060 [Candidatus Geothermincolia bacterium]